MKLRARHWCGAAAIFVVASFLLNWFLTMTYYNPVVMVRAYDWMMRHHLGAVVEAGEKFASTSESTGYPAVAIKTLQHNFFWGPRATVVGTVTEMARMNDGDIHVNVRDAAGDTLVTEFAPELQVPLPAPGQRIKLWGITRYDLAHRWWEIHPVVGWEGL